MKVDGDDALVVVVVCAGSVPSRRWRTRVSGWTTAARSRYVLVRVAKHSFVKMFQCKLDNYLACHWSSPYIKM